MKYEKPYISFDEISTNDVMTASGEVANVIGRENNISNYRSLVNWFE